jgi:hypothetical protein
MGATKPAAGTDPSGAGPSAKTPEERRAEADRKLDASLGDFDAQVRKEQARIAREREERRNSRGSGDGSGAGDGSDSDGRGSRGRRGDGDMRSDKEGREERGDRRDGDMKSDKGGQSGPGSGKGPTTAPPPGVGSGENDDLVAKQLREAAEKETDPELRDKLWKEYQDYKKSVKR